MTIKEMMEQSTVGRRQDLDYLRALARGAPRTVLSAQPELRKDGSLLKREVSAVVQKATVSVNPSPQMDLSFLTSKDPVPVTGLMHQGVPIHPPAKNQDRGLVSVNRSFGGCKRDELLFKTLLTFLPQDLVEEAASRYVYTRGDARGFVKRLREQTSRKCVSVYSYWPRTKSAGIVQRLMNLLPVDLERLSDWSRDLIDQLMDLKTSKVATAGAPYWRDKPDAMAPMIDVVLPIVVEAIQEGRIQELWKEQPELFLGEVKNKLDRYEPDRLEDKCRPYFSLPFHLQALFSMMSQSFTNALYLFHDTPKGVKSANAYGFSWAHGGGTKLAEWASRTKQKEIRFYCYGDDSDVFYRTKDGVLMRISPDFRQMDGSVDSDLVFACIQYVRISFAKKFGNNEFWQSVSMLWLKMATDPDFLVHGTTVYNKKSSDGLMTGVVGTTLFDTAKSVLAYQRFAEEFNHDQSIIEEKKAVAFFQKLGLEIKEGTWKPTPVLEEPTPGEMYSENKFLGTQLVWMQGPERTEPVPYLPTEDWLALLTTPRDDPSVSVGMKSGAAFSVNKVSALSRARTNFDRWRGYLVTGAFSNPDIRDLLYGMISTVDPAAVLMSVSADGGRGEKPEIHTVCGDDFSFPTSEGIPTPEWCLNLYFSDDNQFESSSQPGDPPLWTPVFPTLTEEIRNWREKWRNLKPSMKVLQVKTTGHYEEPVNPDNWNSPGFDAAAVVEKLDEYTPYIEEPEFRKPLIPSEFSKKGTLPTGPPNKRSKIIDHVVKDGEMKAVDRKRLPTTTDLLLKMFETKASPTVPVRMELVRQVYPELVSYAEMAGDEAIIPPPWEYIDDEVLRAILNNPFLGSQQTRDIMAFALSVPDQFENPKLWSTPILGIWEVAQGLGRGTDSASLAETRNICRSHGFYLIGSDQQYVSKVPIFLESEPVLDNKVLQQVQENKKKVEIVSSKQRSIAEVLKAGAPVRMLLRPQINLGALKDLKRLDSVPPEEESKIWEYAHQTLQLNKKTPVVKSRNVVFKGKQFVETQVRLRGQGEEQFEGMAPLGRFTGNSTKENLALIGRELVACLLKSTDPLNPKAGRNKRIKENRKRQIAWSEEVEKEIRKVFRIYTGSGPTPVLQVAGKYAYAVGNTLATNGVEVIDGKVALENGKPSAKKATETWNQFYLRLKLGVKRISNLRIFFDANSEQINGEKQEQQKIRENRGGGKAKTSKKESSK